MQMYEHSVIDVCMVIDGDTRGTSSGMISRVRRAELTQWLRWRIEQWYSPCTQNFWEYTVDLAVRALAVAVLAAADDYDAQWALV